MSTPNGLLCSMVDFTFTFTPGRLSPPKVCHRTFGDCWCVTYKQRWIIEGWKKVLSGRKHCTLAIVWQSQKFSPRRRPPSRGTGRSKLISWRWSLPLPTNRVWGGSMHAISNYRGNRPTHTPTSTQTNKQPDRTDYNTLRHSLACSVIRLHDSLKQHVSAFTLLLT